MLSQGRRDLVSSVHPGRALGGRPGARRHPSGRSRVAVGGRARAGPRAGRLDGIGLPLRRLVAPPPPHPESHSSSPPNAVRVSTTPQRRRTSTDPGRMTGPDHTTSRLISGSRRNADGVPASAARRLLRQAEVDEVAEVVGGETQLQADRALAAGALRPRARARGHRRAWPARPTAPTGAHPRGRARR